MEILPAVARSGELSALRDVALGCTACDLAADRTHVVFGDGDPDADVMFVGEGPGAREDEQGVPFVGPSGKLLDQLLGEIGLERSSVYIGNVVKCRPPGNRDPRPAEIEACKGYLRSQITLVQPKVVVTLGNFAAKLMLPTELGITRLRGNAYPWWDRFLIPTFHPAAALRGSARVLEEMRTDFAIVRDVVDGNLTIDPPEPDPSEPSPPPSSAPADDAEQLGLFGSGVPRP